MGLQDKSYLFCSSENGRIQSVIRFDDSGIHGLNSPEQQRSSPEKYRCY